MIAVGVGQRHEPAIGPAAWIAIALNATMLALLAALHVLSPEFDTSWYMISEDALGTTVGCCCVGNGHLGPGRRD